MKAITTDSLRSLIGGLGDDTRDKAAGVYYAFPYISDDQLVNAYRGSWLARKIVDIPARDSVRAWRNWQAEQDQIGLIEAEEKRLGLRQKVEEARIRARLFGGAAIFIGDGSPNLMEPLDPRRLRKGGIKYLTVLSRVRLTAGPVEQDPTSEYFDEPAHYSVNGHDIHPTRLVRFTGADHPEPFYAMGMANGWGDSVLTAVFEAMKHSDSVMANIASLVFEANVDVFGVPDLMDQLAAPEYKTLMLERFGLVAANKSINRSILRDAAETFDRKTISFASLPELMDKFMQMVSGASDIPATRLFGMSPAGMSSTGESDLRNYYDRVNAEQTLDIDPAMRVLDESLIWSALGTRPPEIWHEWASLWQISEKEKAEIADKMSNVAERLNRTGLISREALSSSVINQFTEDGIYPGLEQATTENPIDFDAMLDDPTPVTTDAAPRTLYIQRKVKNAADIVAWAKSQGFDTTLTAIDLHVTVCYSRAPVDWFKIGEPWTSELKIDAGGPRMIEQFDGGAVVLLFACREISWRHKHVIELGGSHGYVEFQPHITISYDASRLDLSKVEPYQGEIILGPEIFEEVKQ